MCLFTVVHKRTRICYSCLLLVVGVVGVASAGGGVAGGTSATRLLLFPVHTACTVHIYLAVC